MSGEAVASEPALGVMLLSGTHERAHFAFSFAACAAALGRKVVMFASNGGVRALCADWSGLNDVGRDAAIRRRGLTGLGAMRDAARETGVRMIACESGLRAEGVEFAALWEGVEIAGIATFLEAVGGGQIVSV